MKHRLASDAKIVADPCFESAICKILNKQNETLNAEEIEAVFDLIKSNELEEVPDPNTNNQFSLGERGLKKRKLNNPGTTFMDLRCIRPTSTLRERLFFVAGYALNDRLKRILPMNFERQIFLHANSDLWDISDVNDIVNEKGY